METKVKRYESLARVYDRDVYSLYEIQERLYKQIEDLKTINAIDKAIKLARKAEKIDSQIERTRLNASNARLQAEKLKDKLNAG